MGLDADLVWKEAEDLMGHLADADGDESEIAEAVAQFLDALVPLNIILPGVAGIAAESVDDEVRAAQLVDCSQVAFVPNFLIQAEHDSFAFFRHCIVLLCG